MVMITEKVKGMRAFCPNKMRKFCTVVGLDCLGGISEENDCSLYKVDSRIAAVFLVSIDKTLS